MTRSRMAMALLCMAGLFVALYLYLYKIGKIGTLSCGSGGCETVQLSPQSRFMGVEVSLIGVVILPEGGGSWVGLGGVHRDQRWENQGREE